MEGFFNKERILTHGFEERKVTLDATSVNAWEAALCPDYELNPGFYNQLFTGSTFEVRCSKNQLLNGYFDRNGSYLYNVKGTSNDDATLR
jgi:hypothetical protein